MNRQNKNQKTTSGVGILQNLSGDSFCPTPVSSYYHILLNKGGEKIIDRRLNFL